MKGYTLPEHMIESIDSGKIAHNIMSVVESSSLSKDSFFPKYKNDILNYCKAYIVYEISTGYNISASDSLDAEHKLKNGREYTFRKYEESIDDVRQSLSDLKEVFTGAQDDNVTLQVRYLKDRFDYNNLLLNIDSERYKFLTSCFDDMIIKEIDHYADSGILVTTPEEMLCLVKCYMVESYNLSKDDFLCGNKNFVESIIDRLNILIVQKSISLDDYISSRDENRIMIRSLGKTILRNKFGGK